MAKEGKDKIWSYEEATREVNLVFDQKTDVELEKIAQDILANNSISGLLLDKIITLMVEKFKFTRSALKKFLRSEIKKKTEGEDETATHAEIAENFVEEKLPAESVGSEGDLWLYDEDSGIYSSQDLRKSEVKIGNAYPSNNCKTGGHYKAIARQVYIRKLKESFFDKAPFGVAANSNFYRISESELEILVEDYAPAHRARWKLPFDPAPPGTDAPLLRSYLDNAFKGQKEQEFLLQEICGGIITGSFAKLQRAVLLKGEGENGKSVLLDMLTEFLPQNLRTSVRPDQFSDDKISCELAGKYANIVGELDKDSPLDSTFKNIIGVDTPIMARPIWKEPFMFTPRCAHIFASNHFPITRDFSDGFFRRWVIITFKNKVPNKKIRRLGERIAQEEGPQVLRWMLEGATYLLKNENQEMSLTKEHHKAINSWKSAKDSIFAFFNDEEEIKYEDSDERRIPHKECYNLYQDWCRGESRKAVGYQSFMQRAKILIQADFRTPNDRRRSFRGIFSLSAQKENSISSLSAQKQTSIFSLSGQKENKIFNPQIF